MSLLLLGYVRVQLTGAALNEFINACKREGYILYNIIKKHGTLTVDIKSRDYKKVLSLAQQYGINPETQGKFGLLMKLILYKSRRAFFTAIILLSLYYGVNSCFISEIVINGNNVFSDVQIIDALKKNDVYVGRLKFGIDPEYVRDEFIKDFPEVSWLWIEQKGTRLTVNLREKISKPTFFEPDSYCNIVAEKDGVITDAISSGGTLLVSEGMFVKKGDILISGVYNSNEFAPIRFINSGGVVNAKTMYCVEDTFTSEYNKYTKSSHSKNKIIPKILSVSLWDDDLDNSNAVVLHQSDKKLRIYGNNYLPMGFTNTEYYEIIKETCTYTKDEAETKAEEILKEKLYFSLPDDAKVVDIHKKISYNSDGSFNMKLEALCVENIAVRLPIEVG